ncbi:protein kinase family protein [Salinirubellus salinus]|uniref:non-specific serine/threonine protein kinase n=1 Tax=Salinirubellus salinus TaxID=1364945 RepID=A0A9E7UBI4_9EURY|nr:RIO1 family regulatory kinase/ATPase [Salinirubellus salinus]UWM55142.1 protein kinase family protein [Salinirubellus salinus]
MAVRRILRSSVPWADLEGLALALCERYGRDHLRVEFLEADNWLSVPMVVEDEWFVKVVSEQHSRLHALFTAGRNLGAFSAGVPGFFQHFGTPYAMARHELEATRRMRDIGVDAPAPVEVFEYEGYGVVVLEYLDGFRTLDEVSAAEAERLAPALFDALSRMHDAGLAHGDLREENVLVVDDTLYFIDATSVDATPANVESARGYDVACALGSLTPHVGADVAVAAALGAYDPVEVLAAGEFLDFVSLRPDLEFDVGALKGEIEKAASDTG